MQRSIVKPAAFRRPNETVRYFFAIDSRHFATTERCLRNKNQPLNSATDHFWKRRYKMLCSCPQEIKSLCTRTKCLNKVRKENLIINYKDFYLQRRFLAGECSELWVGMCRWGTETHVLYQTRHQKPPPHPRRASFRAETLSSKVSIIRNIQFPLAHHRVSIRSVHTKTKSQRFHIIPV